MLKESASCGCSSRASVVARPCRDWTPNCSLSFVQGEGRIQRTAARTSRVPKKARHYQHKPLQICCASGEHVGSLDASGLNFGVVVGRFNDLVTKLLLDGALDAFKRHGGASSEVVWVPGSFEIPLVAKALAKSGKFDAVLTIGAVVRGATTHYEAVVNSATSGSLGASLESGVPVVFGVLTTETMEQALDRAGGKVGNKGFECAVTAVEMANLMKSLRAKGLAAEAWGHAR